MKRLTTSISFCVFWLLLPRPLFAQMVVLQGRVTDPQGIALAKALVTLVNHGMPANDSRLRKTTSGPDGRFEVQPDAAGQFDLKVEAEGFQPVIHQVSIHSENNPEIAISMSHLSTRIENVTVTADVNQTDIVSPDPGEKVFVRQDLLDANPGHAGAPVSIPGFPVETASSGIKAPQYFAPGVAGDHGEPIAQYIAVGTYLVPNNLSANAHGNGYSDPNLLIPDILESVQIDGGAFNVREGNHAVNLAATYGLRSSLAPFLLTVTGDSRDISAVAGFSPAPDSFVALSAAYGNGFLGRLEHRQQYKLNGERIFDLGQHRLTLLGIGYYGVSYIPGLVPIDAPNAFDANVAHLGDTIDPRQHDQTHTALVAGNDVWQLSGNQQLQLSSFFRTYNLSLFSNFGHGLIRQSEFRTVAGSSASYTKKLSQHFSWLAGLDYEREAPRRVDLDHYPNSAPGKSGLYGPFTPVGGNGVTIASITPYIAADGALTHYLRYYLGWRRDQISVDNNDLLHQQNSFHKLVGVNSPKATVSLLPKQSWHTPLLSLSFGQAFFTADPRRGTGTTPGTPVATSHSYQLVASKTIHQTDLKLTLGQVTSSAELAKIDPDTGLQFNQGPSRLRFLSFTVRRNSSLGSLQSSISRADARDRNSGQPTPEAPRTIFDLLGTMEKLPFHLEARGEFEYVAAKPLGTGCNPGNLNAECLGTPVKEFRGALVRPFLNQRIDVGVNFLIASGYTGQTTESFEPSQIQEVVGVRIPCYASVSLTYRFGRSDAP
jgi:hypothetical protein